MIGIYCIKFPNGRKYIGQSKDIEKRIKDHLKCCNSNPFLSRCVEKYRETLEVVILEECIFEDLTEREQYYIDADWDSGMLLNSNKLANRPPDRTGIPRSEETRAKISSAHTGKSKSPEHCKAISESNKRRKGKMAPMSEESKRKKSIALKGIPKSAEHKSKLSAAKKGRTLSAETKAKMAEAQRLRWEKHRQE